MKLLVGIAISICVSVLSLHTVHAISQVIISQVQPGDSISALNESTEIYNNSNTDQDITNWCIRYSAATSLSYSGPKYCFTSSDSQTKIYLTTQSYASIVTTGYTMPSGLAPDGRFSGSGMASTGGNIRLLDGAGMIADSLGWGTSTLAEGYSLTNFAPVAPTATQALLRKVSSGAVLQETDNNRADFELKTPNLRTGGVYEVRIPIDLCAVLPGIQETMPVGYGYDEAGNCDLLSNDVCLNIAAIQITVPSNLQQDETKSCYTDTCTNIDGLQRDVPVGYTVHSGQCVKLEDHRILLSEILSNVSGSDTGKEFIELYNPNDIAVNISGYHLQIGKNFEQDIVLGSSNEELFLPSHGYVVYSDEDLHFTLLNTTDSLRIIAPAGNTVDATTYSEPKEDQSWSLINGAWQYTNQLTPNADNLAMLVVLEETEATSSSVSITSCPASKYRNPLTNRCRNIESDASVLASCDADEYRNPETNRCRKLATLASDLTPCNEGYERNAETNRCRKIVDASVAGASTCKDGYERNPDTNRCRKVVAEITAATPVASKASNSNVQTALLVTSGVGAVSYGLYEWRSELGRGIAKIIALVSGK